MLKPSEKSGGLAYSDKSKVNHDNSKSRDALNDGFENDDVESGSVDSGASIANKINEKERDVPNVKPKQEKYDDLASSGT